MRGREAHVCAPQTMLDLRALKKDTVRCKFERHAPAGESQVEYFIPNTCGRRRLRRLRPYQHHLEPALLQV